MSEFYSQKYNETSVLGRDSFDTNLREHADQLPRGSSPDNYKHGNVSARRQASPPPNRALTDSRIMAQELLRHERTPKIRPRILPRPSNVHFDAQFANGIFLWRSCSIETPVSRGLVRLVIDKGEWNTNMRSLGYLGCVRRWAVECVPDY